MKQQREDQRRVTMRYRHDAETGRTVLVIDVESLDEDMPHEHRRDMREIAEQALGMPLGDLPEGIEVNLRRATPAAAHPEGDHDHDDAHGEPGHTHGPKAVKA